MRAACLRHVNALLLSVMLHLVILKVFIQLRHPRQLSLIKLPRFKQLHALLEIIRVLRKLWSSILRYVIRFALTLPKLPMAHLHLTS